MAEPNPASQEPFVAQETNGNTTATTVSQEKEVEHNREEEPSSTTEITGKQDLEPESGSTSEGASEPVSDHAEVKAEEAAKPTPEEQRSKGKTALIMAALMMAVFLAALDMTIVTTALPTIASEFQVSNADYSWVGSAYLLGAAASAAIGPMSQAMGYGWSYTVLAAFFLVSSIGPLASMRYGMRWRAQKKARQEARKAGKSGPA